MKGTVGYKRSYTPPKEDVELDEILVTDLVPSQDELEYLISWGEIEQAMAYAEQHRLRATPLKFLVSRVVSFCCEKDQDIVNTIQKLFWKETV